VSTKDDHVRALSSAVSVAIGAQRQVISRSSLPWLLQDDAPLEQKAQQRISRCVRFTRCQRYEAPNSLQVEIVAYHAEEVLSELS
jgi:hypothetical protein